MKKLISIVIPAFNESENIKPLVERISEVFKNLYYNYELIFVNDGSSDDTQKVLMTLNQVNPKINYIELSRNFGHQNALKAGLDMANGDCVISMDCDLQHPPELIPQFLEKWEDGYEIVYSVRRDSDSLTGFKRNTSKIFYSVINTMSDINLEAGTADFRLLDKKVISVFSNFSESEPFIRGLIKWLGFKQYAIEYTPGDRYSGKSHYTFKKMMGLALQGITSFSIKPLHTAVYLGFLFSVLSLLYIPYVVYSFYSGTEIHGWASMIMTVVFFGGLQLIILGIIGIYIGKLFIQAKRRPNYIVRNTTLN
jgi:glycosyltransferase involved in cell wall biosynthesis